ncbi:MAG: flagellar motor switch phosphatase FliY [Clostridia bacterium]|nr:MAG: flagellar motor switch phosphatase FliY [Clostridia bacterium]
MADELLSQSEIDALLNQALVQAQPAPILEQMDEDALGEIGNISMGSAATALSQIINQRVTITTPRVRVSTIRELFSSFTVPYALVQVLYTEGLDGANLLVIKVSDAAVIADLMMGGDGSNPSAELSELALSAVGEAMNQMIGSAATAMSSMFQRRVVISPPLVSQIRAGTDTEELEIPWGSDAQIVIVSFRMVIGELVDSEIMQVMPLAVAQEEVKLLLGDAGGQPAEEEILEGGPQPEEAQPRPPSVYATDEPEGGADYPLPYVTEPPAPPAAPEYGKLPRNIELILDVPLNVSVILGRTRRPIKEVLSLIPGSVVELDKLANEPVEVLVNGYLIAEGEVVVVNENFGVQVKRIVRPEERIKRLG